MNWDKLFASPFKSDVYFFSTREQIDQRWGTQAPITVRDKSFGMIRLRAHGTYSYQIEDPRVFYQKISGSREQYTTQELEGQLRSLVLTSLASLLGGADMSFLDMAANQMAFSDHLREGMAKPFSDYGLKLATFFVQSITLPEEVEKHLDRSTSMRMVGDLRKYTQFQVADSIPIAAEQPGGLAAAGVGLGAGMAMGSAFGSSMMQGGSGGGDSGGADDPFETLNKLHDLMSRGILTQEEFEAKKAEILRKIT
jgi:membrane protease subunit (stomatin/prohibitin family)